MRDNFTIGDSRFNAEFILRLVTMKVSFIEIPVHYIKRVGRSGVTGNKMVALIVGFGMMALITKTFFLKMFNKLDTPRK